MFCVYFVSKHFRFLVVPHSVSCFTVLIITVAAQVLISLSVVLYGCKTQSLALREEDAEGNIWT
jgi:uncharacterized membrane protein SpoIIM required for sporulation